MKSCSIQRGASHADARSESGEDLQNRICKVVPTWQDLPRNFCAPILFKFFWTDFHATQVLALPLNQCSIGAGFELKKPPLR